MRVQRKRTALESTEPLLLWCIILAPLIALVIGVGIDYTSSFDVRQFTILSQYCHEGCTLTYTVNNRFGVIPINYLQIASYLTHSEPSSDGPNNESPLNELFRPPSPSEAAVPCPAGILTSVTSTSETGSNQTSPSYKICSDIRSFGTGSLGSLNGFALDTPSQIIDGRLQAISAKVHVPPFQSNHNHEKLIVQFALVSPLYIIVRVIFQAVFIAISIGVFIAYRRAVLISNRMDSAAFLPEQPYCTALLIFLILWLNPISVLRLIFAPATLFREPDPSNDPSLLVGLSCVYLLERVCCDIGCQGILFCLLCIANGISGNIKIYEDDDDCRASSYVAGDEMRYTFPGENPDEPYRIIDVDDHSERYPIHHPESLHFFGFFVRKVSFFFLGVFLILLKYSLRFPALLNIPFETSQSQNVVNAIYYLLTSGVYFCTLVWAYLLYKSFAVCVYRYSAPPFRSAYLGAGNGPDFSRFDIYARLAVRLTMYQLALWLFLVFLCVLFWVHASGWISGIYDILSTPLIKPFHNEIGDGGYSATMTFSNKSFHSRILQNSSSLLYKDTAPNSGNSEIRSFFSFLAQAANIIWVNVSRFWSLDPSFTEMILCCVMCFSTVYSFLPAGINMRHVIPFGNDCCYSVEPAANTLHRKYDEWMKQDMAIYTALVDEAVLVDNAGPSSYGAVDQRDLEAGHSSPDAPALFCLETACLLLECSWQTYFKPRLSHIKIEKAVRGEYCDSSGLLDEDKQSSHQAEKNSAYRDIEHLKLRLVQDVVSSEFQLRSFIAVRSSDNIVVVAFRGTYGMNNVKTDLTLNQTNLPDLQLKLNVINKENRSLAVDVDILWSDVLADFVSRQTNPFDTDSEDENVPSSQAAHHDDAVAAEDQTRHAEHEIGVKQTPITLESFLRDSLKFLRDGVTVVSSLISRCCIKEGPRVHAGFWAAYSVIRCDIYKGILRAYLELIVSNNRGDTETPSEKIPKIYFCGHSLGGALATLAALDISINISYIMERLLYFLRKDARTKALLSVSKESVCNSIFGNLDISLMPPCVEIYTFGAPRVGNPEFKILFEKHVVNSFRIEVNADMICRTPALTGYRHASTVPVLLCEAVSTDSGSQILHQTEEWWNVGADAHNVGTHLTSLLINPTYVQFLLLRQHTSSPEYHSLVAYRNYLESMFKQKEKIEYYEKYKRI